MIRPIVPYPIPGDAAQTANMSVMGRSGRESPKILRQSRVSKTINVCPEWDASGLGNTRFMVRHGLPGKPDHVWPYLKSINGYNENSVPSGLVCVQPAHPFADGTFSYFTVAFPQRSWFRYGVVFDAIGVFNWTLDVKCGVPVFAAGWPLNTAFYLNQPPLSWGIAGQTVTFWAAAFAERNLQVWTGLPVNTYCVIEVLSEIRESYDRSESAASSTLVMPYP